MPVPFRFDTVLRVREAERDRCRTALVEELQREAMLVAERDRVVAERDKVFDELRKARLQDGHSADQERMRREYADKLAAAILQVETALSDTTVLLKQRRDELAEVDASVKSLEKLAGRHSSQQLRMEQSNSERDLGDAWRSGRVA